MGKDIRTSIDILLVEDNPGDVELVREVLQEGNLRCELHVAADGIAALRFLKGEEGTPRPDLILLDLNLPRKSGWEVLSDIKRDPDLLTVPVIVLTSSSSADDILHAYSLHANCYLTKPVDFERYTRLVKLIEEFWLKVVKLPYRH